MRKLLLLLALSIICNTAVAQVYPTDGDTVNYRMVGFKVPEKKNSTGYILEVHEYLIRDDGTVHTKFLFEQQGNENKIVATVPAFGKSYKWQVKYLQQGNVTDSTGFNFFYIAYPVSANKEHTRLRVIKDSDDSTDFYVFNDATRTLYNKKGEVVWFLPNIPGIVDSNTSIRDLELTPFNTITFLTTSQACEIDYDGKILWKAPNNGLVSGDTVEYYHHEFTRLNNGNYMVMGTKSIQMEIPESALPFFKKKGQSINKGRNRKGLAFGTLIEYDSTGKIIWSWFAGDHFTNEDLFTPVSDSTIMYNTHMNAFYFNEENRTIYISYRNISRVMKISYPSGMVLANYGRAYTPARKIYGDGMFYGQHSCRISKDGELYLFNNNNNVFDSTSKKISSIVFFNEPKIINDDLKKTWEFYCDTDTLFDPFTIAGGGVRELSNGDVLVCTAKGHIFKVSRSKKITWDSALEKQDTNGEWIILNSGYRCSAIESKEHLEKIILAAQK